MHVFAVSTLRYSGWRWRIVTYAGETVEESPDAFPTIASAVAAGAQRLAALNVIDRSVRASPYRRSTSHLRSR